MKSSVVKYFYELGYGVRQTAIISEVSEDYVRKIISGKRAQDIAASDEEVTEGMMLRKKTIDYVMALKGIDGIDSDQKYNYISLLSYMGFTLPELHLLFPSDQKSFIGVAAMRSGEAWKHFDATSIGLPQDAYNFTFIEKVATYEATTTQGEPDTTYLEASQKNRKANKLKNREMAKNKKS